VGEPEEQPLFSSRSRDPRCERFLITCGVHVASTRRLRYNFDHVIASGRSDRCGGRQPVTDYRQPVVAGGPGPGPKSRGRKNCPCLTNRLFTESASSPPPLSLSLSLCDLPEGSYVKKPSNLLARARTSVSVCAVYV